MTRLEAEEAEESAIGYGESYEKRIVMFHPPDKKEQTEAEESKESKDNKDNKHKAKVGVKEELLLGVQARIESLRVCQERWRCQHLYDCYIPSTLVTSSFALVSLMSALMPLMSLISLDCSPSPGMRSVCENWRCPTKMKSKNTLNRPHWRKN